VLSILFTLSVFVILSFPIKEIMKLATSIFTDIVFGSLIGLCFNIAVCDLLPRAIALIALSTCNINQQENKLYIPISDQPNIFTKCFGFLAARALNCDTYDFVCNDRKGKDDQEELFNGVSSHSYK
jgi:hypothetical protein